VALVEASGGRVVTKGERTIRFNNEAPTVHSIFAFGKDCPVEITSLFAGYGWDAETAPSA
jgi:hypothetical protein